MSEARIAALETNLAVLNTEVTGISKSVDTLTGAFTRDALQRAENREEDLKAKREDDRLRKRRQQELDDREEARAAKIAADAAETRKWARNLVMTIITSLLAGGGWVAYQAPNKAQIAPPPTPTSATVVETE